MQNQIVIDDPTIVSYFKENSHLDIIKMNHVLIYILKSLSKNKNNDINTDTNSKITDSLSVLNNSINSMKLEFIMKLFEIKKEYTEDIKNMFITNSLKNNEKFISIIEKNNDNMISKMILSINDIIEKSKDKNAFNNFETLICRTIEGQIIRMTTSIQQPILSSISSSLNIIKDNFNQQKIVQQNLYNDINNLLNSLKNQEDSKCNDDPYFIIQSLMPTDEIIKNSDTNFKVNRQNKANSSVIFEIKNCLESVTTDEVNNFELITQSQKTHGIMISQKSPITYKNNYQIDINNEIINIYVTYAEYSIEKIKIALDIIDNLNLVFNNLENKKDLNKTSEILVKKDNVETDNTGLLCTFCNNWSGKNKISLSAHIRSCKFNPKNFEK